MALPDNTSPLVSKATKRGVDYHCTLAVLVCIWSITPASRYASHLAIYCFPLYQPCASRGTDGGYRQIIAAS